MKKVLLGVVICLLFMTVSVSAMSESKLLDKLTAKYDINGVTFQLSESDRVLAKRYLDENEVSSSDADYIASKIDEAISAMKDSGAKDFTDFTKLPSALKTKLKKLVHDVASETSVKATVTKDNVVIYNTDGSVFAEIDGLVKNTGSKVNLVVPAAILVVTVGAFVLVKNVKANA